VKIKKHKESKKVLGTEPLQTLESMNNQLKTESPLIKQSYRRKRRNSAAQQQALSRYTSLRSSVYNEQIIDPKVNFSPDINMLKMRDSVEES
jgi:hypothetical protein